MASSKRNKTAIVGLVGALLLGGCGDYMNHRDRIVLRSGDASASNTAIQTIQAWPPEAYNTNIESGG